MTVHAFAQKSTRNNPELESNRREKGTAALLSPFPAVSPNSASTPLTAGSVMALQRICGNRYVLQLLRQQRTGQTTPLQRHSFLTERTRAVRRCSCGGAAAEEDGECAACKAKRLARMSASQKTQEETMQRKGEKVGHNLTAAQFTGEPTLEACFDGTAVLNPGKSGTPVTKIQEALIGLGFALPKHGADGKYGSETVSAVQQFQTSSGMTGAEVDGTIGKKTMGLLDMAARDHVVEKDTDEKANDLKVRGKYADAASEPMTVFFDLGKAELDDAEKQKIAKIAKKHPEEPLILKGMASEEGSKSFNAQLARDRISVVSSALFDAQHEGFHIHEPGPESGSGDLNYRKARAVKVLLEPENKDNACPPGKNSKIKCEENFESLLKESIPKARAMIEAAEKKLPPTGDAIAIFDSLFGTDASTRDDTVTKVKKIMGDMKEHIARMSEPDKHECANECDGICKEGSPAYNSDRGRSEKRPNPPGVLVMCPAFLKKDPPPELVLVHEGHHGTPDIPSADFAYQNKRLITQLDTETALKNAASFHLFIEWVKDPAKTQIGPKDKDKQGNLTDAEKKAMDLPVAWLEQWLIMGSFDLSSLYARLRNARSKGKWDNNGEFLMGLVAPRFRLTPPPALPTKNDQEAVAAIYDRLDRMERAFKSALEFSKVPAGGKNEWERGPGKKVTVTQDFFSLPPSRQMVVLIQELVHATTDVSAASEPEYVGLIEDLRQSRNLGGPTP